MDRKDIPTYIHFAAFDDEDRRYDNMGATIAVKESGYKNLFMTSWAICSPDDLFSEAMGRSISNAGLSTRAVSTNMTPPKFLMGILLNPRVQLGLFKRMKKHKIEFVKFIPYLIENCLSHMDIEYQDVPNIIDLYGNTTSYYSLSYHNMTSKLKLDELKDWVYIPSNG